MTSIGGKYKDLDSLSAADSPLSEKLSFLRKVYTIVSVQLLCTFGAVYLFQDSTSMLKQNTWIVAFSACIQLFLMILLICQPQLIMQSPSAEIFLTIFTISESVLIGVVCSMVKASIVNQAILITAIITVSCTVYALTTKRDLSGLGFVLYIGLMLLISMSLMALIFRTYREPRGPFNFVMICFGALLFTGLIIFDTNRIANECPPELYIFAALTLYLDIINLFLYILRIIAATQD